MKKEYVFPANDLVYDKKIETDDDLKDYIKHLEHNLLINTEFKSYFTYIKRKEEYLLHFHEINNWTWKED
jgi:hypothetical protein